MRSLQQVQSSAMSLSPTCILSALLNSLSISCQLSFLSQKQSGASTWKQSCCAHHTTRLCFQGFNKLILLHHAQFCWLPADRQGHRPLMLINICITVVPRGLNSGLHCVMHPTNILKIKSPLVLFSPQVYTETRSSA